MKVLKKIKRPSLFLLVMCFVVGNLSAQSEIGMQLPPYQMPVFVSPVYKSLDTQNSQLDIIPYAVKTSFYTAPAMPPAFNSPFIDDVLTTFAVINGFNANTMPFFCKMEFHMEKASGFPVKFRLGDVQYVDMLEGKD